MANAVDESLGVNLKILTALRLFSYENPSILFQVQAVTLYVSLIILAPSLAVLHIVLSDELDWTEVNFTGAYLGEAFTLTLKLVPFLIKGQQLKKCIFFFADPQFTPDGEEQRNILNENVNICRRNTKVFIVILGLGWGFWSLRPLFMSKYKLPIDVWLPVRLEDHTIVYFFMYIYMSMSVGYGAWAGVADPLIGGLACLAAGHLRVLSYDLIHLDPESNMSVRVRRCIRYHTSILTFVKEFEECFSVAVFSQFSMSSISLCFVIVELQKPDISSLEIFLSVVCVFIGTGQVFFYCYYGTLLFEENYRLGEAIYMGRWYEYEVECRRPLLVLMERSKRPLIVTAGKLLDLSLETFTTLLKRTYTLVTALRNLQ